jgi:hypothetical protein
MIMRSRQRLESRAPAQAERREHPLQTSSGTLNTTDILLILRGIVKNERFLCKPLT